MQVQYNIVLATAALVAIMFTFLNIGHTKRFQHPAIEPVHILLVGDSLTEGYEQHGTHFHPYAINLRSLLSARNLIRNPAEDVEICAKSGDLVHPIKGGIYQRMTDSISATSRPWNWAIILGGTNDIGMGETPETTMMNLKKLWQQALNLGASNILVMTLPDVDVGTGKPTAGIFGLNKLIVQEFATNAREKPTNIHLLDLNKELPHLSLNAEERQKYWGDNIHPTNVGYDLMGSIIFERLIELGLDKP